MMKRIISILVISLMLIALLPVLPAGAETEIKIGDYIQMGTYYDEPILWRCVDIDENGPLILSDKIICFKAFDAEMSANSATGSHSRRLDYYTGSTLSNYWGDSNIRSWLNSTESAGNVNWLCGNPPTDDYVTWDAYADEAGFLTNFSQGELNAIKEVTQKSLVHFDEYSNNIYTTGTEPHTYNSNIADVVANYDKAYAEFITDNMFLLDVKQINMVYNNRAILGDNYYIGTPTAQAVTNSELENSSLVADKEWNSWLRSPYADSSTHLVRYIASDGSVDSYDAWQGYGIRPAFYLSYNAAFTSGNGTQDNPYIVESGFDSFHDIEAIELQEHIAVLYNGTPISFDQEPIIEDGRTLVPLRAIFETLGATVNWNGETQTVTAQKGSDVVSLTIGSNILYKNSSSVELDVPAQIVNDRTLIPVRAIAEAFGCNVGWNGDTKTVTITE